MRFGPFAGLAPRHAQRPNSQFATIAHDVDLSGGTLKPWRTDRFIAVATGVVASFMLEDCCLQQYTECADVARVTLPCLAYYRTGVAGYLEVSETGCGGWCRPLAPCTLAAPSVVYGEMNQTEGKVIGRRYFYTLVDAFGNESGPSPASDLSVQAWDDEAVVAGFDVPGAPYCIAAINIYTTAPDGGGYETKEIPKDNFFLVGTIGASETMFIHRPADTQYGDAFIADEADEAPAGLTNIQWWGTNQLAGIADGKLYFSRRGAPGVWPASYALGFLSPALRWQATERYGYVLTCGRPEVIDLQADCKDGRCHSVRPLEESLPLMGPRSVARWRDGVIYASVDGLVYIQGTRASILTRDLFTREQWLALQPQAMIGVVHDGHYFWSNALGTYRLKLPGNEHDPQGQDILTTLSVEASAWYEASDGRLYFADSVGIHEWNGGDTFGEYHWRSTELTLPPGAFARVGKLFLECGRSVQFSIGTGCNERVRFTRQVDSDQAFVVQPTRLRPSFWLDLAGSAEVSLAVLSPDRASLGTG